MKAGIHPELKQTKVYCNGCNNEFTTEATVEAITVDICSNCHPFYTGKQKLVDTAGRVEKFKARAEAAKKSKAALAKRNAGKASVASAGAEAEASSSEKSAPAEKASQTSDSSDNVEVVTETAREADADSVANENTETEEIAEEFESKTVDSKPDEAKPKA